MRLPPERVAPDREQTSQKKKSGQHRGTNQNGQKKSSRSPQEQKRRPCLHYCVGELLQRYKSYVGQGFARTSNVHFGVVFFEFKHEWLDWFSRHRLRQREKEAEPWRKSITRRVGRNPPKRKTMLRNDNRATATWPYLQHRFGHARQRRRRLGQHGL